MLPIEKDRRKETQLLAVFEPMTSWFRGGHFTAAELERLTLPMDPMTVPLGKTSPQVFSGFSLNLKPNFSAKIFT